MNGGKRLEKRWDGRLCLSELKRGEGFVCVVL